MLHGFLLGLATGSACVAYCAPVLLPYLVAEGNAVRRNAVLLMQFLAGRLGGYLVFSVLAWGFGRQVQALPGSVLPAGAAYLLLGVLLAAYGFRSAPTRCAAQNGNAGLSALSRRWPEWMPPAMGFLTGLNLCPPFIAALAEASTRTRLADSVLLFTAFFLATTLFFVPFPFAGLLRRFQVIQTVARLTAGIMGVYYFYKGLILLYGGIR